MKAVELDLALNDCRVIHIGIRPRSWALPLLITFTPTLWELALGPFYIANETIETFPF